MGISGWQVFRKAWFHIYERKTNALHAWALRDGSVRALLDVFVHWHLGGVIIVYVGAFLSMRGLAYLRQFSRAVKKHFQARE